MTLFVVFDVESRGLHGEGFAVGAVVINDEGETLDTFYESCPPEEAGGTLDGLLWVQSNVPIVIATKQTPLAVRDSFWTWWGGIQRYSEQMFRTEQQKVYLCADVPWPVEANFLEQCIRDDFEHREWQGPYPLIDIASVRLAAGLDPLATEPRLERELPKHDPLADARQSARLLYEALMTVGGALGSMEALHG